MQYLFVLILDNFNVGNQKKLHLFDTFGQYLESSFLTENDNKIV